MSQRDRGGKDGEPTSPRRRRRLSKQPEAAPAEPDAPATEVEAGRKPAAGSPRKRSRPSTPRAASKTKTPKKKAPPKRDAEAAIELAPGQGLAPEIPGETPTRGAPLGVVGEPVPAPEILPNGDLPRTPAVVPDPPRREAVAQDQLRADFQLRPPLEPPAFPISTRAERPADTQLAPRRLAFVLHAHLPWVLGHGTWPHGEDWLAEAVVHCYLPLLDLLDRLAERGRRHLLALSVTPVLAAMLEDGRTPAVVDRYLEERTRSAWENRARHPLAAWWHDEFLRLRALWDRFDHDLVTAMARLWERGAIELSTSAGTHVYLPLAHTPKLIRLALRTGRERHRELFGDDPRGCWMPECAYRPGGPWRHPVTGASEETRPGNESYLAEQGLRWTVVDAHLLRRGDPAFPYGADLLPEEVVEPSGPHPHPYWIRQSAVAAFLRDARTAAQVWSRQGGYPGDGSYLDFHKRHWPSGLRFWRVTGSEADLADKLVYFPGEAVAIARAQAEHFVALARELDGMGDGVICCPFDAELFGHWWFEGPQWLEHVLELAAPGSGLETTTPGREIEGQPLLRRAFFAEGSWGAGGDHRVWVNPETEHFWRELAEAERRAFAAVRWGGKRLWRRAILNQLLLAAASDWPFLVTMGTGRDYAEARFRLHIARLHELIDLGPRTRTLPGWVPADLPFADIEAEWARPPEE